MVDNNTRSRKESVLNISIKETVSHEKNTTVMIKNGNLVTSYDKMDQDGVVGFSWFHYNWVPVEYPTNKQIPGNI